MGAFRRWLARLAESDETRLDNETRGWADSIEGSVRLGEVPLRRKVRIAGVIRRITVLPMSGHEALEALVSDGTGEAVVVFMGRRGIGGFSLGTKVVVEGVLGEQQGGGPPRMINPKLEFSS
jgi:hypothetical protein